MNLLPHHKSGARDFFLYLLMGGTFYFVLFNFVALLFNYIDDLLPDVARMGYSYFPEKIRFHLSALIVLFPVYVAVAWFLRRDLNKNTEKIDFPLRKFFIYLTLFLAAVTLIVDLITLINTYLQGELTARFLLKVLVVFVSAIGVSSYFWYEIKRGPSSPPSKLLVSIASAVVLITVIGGLVLAGSPATQRKYRIDGQRVGNITQLANEVTTYWNTNGKVPVDLKELEAKSTYDIPTDPDTKQPYEYVVTGVNKYKLCATFALESNPSRQYYDGNQSYSPIYYNYEEKVWRHPAGNYCYEFEIKDRTPFDSDKMMESVPVNAPPLSSQSNTPRLNPIGKPIPPPIPVQ